MKVFAQRSGERTFTLLHECAEAYTFHCPGLALHMASILEAGGHVVLQVHISRGASLLWLIPIMWASRGEAKSSPRADSATMQNKTQLREAVKRENASMYTWRAARKPTLLCCTSVAAWVDCGPRALQNGWLRDSCWMLAAPYQKEDK